MKKICLLMLFLLIVILPNPAKVFSREIKVNSRLKDIFNNSKNWRYIKNQRLKELLASPDYRLKSIEFEGKVDQKIKYDIKNTKFKINKKGKLEINEDTLNPPEAITSSVAKNYDTMPQVSTISLSKTTSTEESWENSDSIALGVSVTAGVDVPLLAEAETTVSTEYTKTWSHAKTKGEEKSWEYGLEMTIKPRHQVKGYIIVQKLDLSLKYVMDFILSGNVKATFESTAKKRGITFYRDAHYKGEKTFYKVGTKIDNIRYHDQNEFSSYKVHGNVKVDVWKDNYYKGDHKVIRSNCDWIGDDWNDEIESVKVSDAGNIVVNFKLEKNLNKKNRTFSINGVWKGVSAYNGNAVIGKQTPLDKDDNGPSCLASSNSVKSSRYSPKSLTSKSKVSKKVVVKKIGLVNLSKLANSKKIISMVKKSFKKKKFNSVLNIDKLKLIKLKPKVKILKKK